MQKTFKLKSGNKLTIAHTPGLWMSMRWSDRNPSEDDYAEYRENVHRWVRAVLPRNREFTVYESPRNRLGHVEIRRKQPRQRKVG